MNQHSNDAMRIFQSTDLSPYTGPWNTAEVRHLLKRTLFGASPADIAFFQSKNLSGTLDILLNTADTMPDPPIKEYTTQNAALPDNSVTAGNTWVKDPNTDGTIASLRRASFKKWWAGLMVEQKRSIREKMCLFWHNHFATETVDVSLGQLVYKHHDLIRKYALGNIKELTKEICIDPAMLRYLNGQNNRKGTPDENFAREIQELFVIGKGEKAAFTETDVKEAAKVFTGWQINNNQIASYFNPDRHDTTNKTFSAFYGNKVIQGKTGTTGGWEEINAFVDMLFTTEEAALFLCRKLYTWFVYYEITPEVESGIIAPLAAIMRQNNYEILPVLKALFGSSHFFDNMNRSCQIKSPADLMIGLLRETETVFPTPDKYTIRYGLFNQIVNYLAQLQQNIGDPPDVSGWKAYYQVPGFYQYWLNADTLQKRLQYLSTLVTSGYTFSGTKMVVDPLALCAKMSNPSNPDQLILDLVEHFLALPLTQQHLNQLKRDFLLAGQSSDYYWTNAWDTYVQNPGLMSNTQFVKTALTNLLKYLIELPEYQLC